MNVMISGGKVMNWVKFSSWSENGVLIATYIKLSNGNWALAGFAEYPVTKYGLLSVATDDESEIKAEQCHEWDYRVAEIRRMHNK